MPTQKISQPKNIYQLTSLVVYLLAVLGASALLLIEPNGFDAKALIAPLIIVLFASALGIGQRIAGTNNSKGNSKKGLSVLGTIALAILLTFIGFFIVAAVGWCIGLSHAQ